ncbi:ethionine resistance protein [Coemansia biformis]|uniref:Ethionine resistance protein n=1 Tax=Coemansia biformis TaxID=1286918 RepID=A0A9W7YG92_9FUNG|nr:ethionine resistance protein [Coemansia biformis]
MAWIRPPMEIGGDVACALPGEEAPLISRLSETTLTDQHLVDDELNLSRAALVKQEAWWLLTSSVPLVLTYLCQNSFNFVSMLSVGRLGVNELAAASLAVMIVNCVVLMPSVGLANALETFCCAAFTASPDKTRVGFHMQRGLVAVTLQLVPGVLLFAHIDPLLELLGQTDEVSALCGRFLRIWLLGSWPQLAFECLKRFTQAQGIMQASTRVMAVVMPIHVAGCYLLVWSPTFGLGFAGAPLATVISNWLLLLGMVLCIALGPARAAWGGWTWECLHGIWEFYRMAIPSAAMLACSWAAFEMSTFGASIFGPVSMAAQACIFTAMAMTFQTPNAVGSAAATRIGNSLGMGKQRRARYAAYTAIGAGYIIGIVSSLLLFWYRRGWGYIFTDDRQVAELCAHLMPYFAAVQTYDGMNGVTGGIMRALGKQGLGAMLAFPAFWLLGIPLGFYLAIGPPRLEVVGLWLGLAAAVIAFSLPQQWYILFRVDWRHEVKVCLARLDRSSRPKYLAQSPEPQQACAAADSYGAIV